MNIKQNKGFTLIEILIVVAIIAILASVVLVGLGPTQEAGRDARRISDLQEVQNGLELYFNKCGYYPGNNTTAVCDDTATTGYASMSTALTTVGVDINSIPGDPLNSGVHIYSFATDGASATSYVLGAVLENPNNSVFTSYNAPADYNTDTIPAALSCTGSGDYCISL